MGRLSLIDRYLARTIWVPLISTLVLAAMLLILDKMVRLLAFVVNAGGPISVVWRMLANLLPEYFSLGIPIGLMLGILLAFRKLALSSELDSLRGIGVGYTRLLKVPYMFAFGLMLVNAANVGWLQPYAEYGYQHLRFDLTSGALGASINVGEFNQFGKRMTLRIDGSEANGTKLTGIFTAANDGKGNSVTATAEEGRFLATDDPNTIVFRLKRGRLIQDNPSFRVPRTLAFDNYDFPIKLPAIDKFRGRGNDLAELNFIEMFRRAYLGAAASPTDQLAARATFNFRLVEVIMMLMLPLLAVALAVPPKRSTSALGIFLSIVIVVTYHKINQYAAAVGSQGRIPPEVALYTPFALFAGMIWWMYHVLAHRPGGQPIGALEALAARLSKQIRRLIKRRDQAPAVA